MRTTAVLKPSALCLLQNQRHQLISAYSNEATPAPTVAVLRHSTAGSLHWASVLLPQLLADAAARRLQPTTTTEEPYSHVLASFAAHPDPAGILLQGVCRQTVVCGDLTTKQIVLTPA